MKLCGGTSIDGVPAPTKNFCRARDPEMHSSKKGNQWSFGMKAHIGVDADLGLVHIVQSTTGHVQDVNEANILLHGQEHMVFADAGYQGIDNRPDTKPDVTWHVAMRSCKRKALNKSNAADILIDAAEKLKASVRAKVQHPFDVIKRKHPANKC